MPLSRCFSGLEEDFLFGCVDGVFVVDAWRDFFAGSPSLVDVDVFDVDEETSEVEEVELIIVLLLNGGTSTFNDGLAGRDVGADVTVEVVLLLVDVLVEVGGREVDGEMVGEMFELVGNFLMVIDVFSV